MNYCCAAGIFQFSLEIFLLCTLQKTSKSAAQPSGRVKIFCSEQQQQVRAAVKKKLEGTLLVNAK
jgi:hypothetical protein